MAVTSLRTVARKPAVVRLLVGAVLFVVLYGLILHPAAGLTEAVGRDSTLTGRTAMWDQLLQLKVDPWFGAGYESFWLGPRTNEISRHYQYVNQAHNGYLEVFLNLGWAGVALLGLVMAWGFRNVVRALCRDPEAGLEEPGIHRRPRYRQVPGGSIRCPGGTGTWNCYHRGTQLR